jgi:hypothetical protein
MHRIVPSSGGQPIMPPSASPFAKASHTGKNHRKNGYDTWGPSVPHARKVLLLAIGMRTPLSCV